MYTKIRNITFTPEKNRILLEASEAGTGRDSWRRLEYAPEVSGYREKLVRFYEEVLADRFRPEGDGPFADIYRTLHQLLGWSRTTSELADYRYGLTTVRDMRRVIAECYADHPYASPQTILRIREQDEANEALYQKVHKELLDTGHVFVKTACESQAFPGFHVYLDGDGAVLLGPSDHYRGRGIVANADHTLLLIRPVTGQNGWTLLTTGTKTADTRQVRAFWENNPEAAACLGADAAQDTGAA